MSEAPRPRVAVVVFPGSNDDRDAALAFEQLGADPVLVWHAEAELPEQVVAGTRARYVEAFERLTGLSFDDYLADPQVVLR